MVTEVVTENAGTAGIPGLVNIQKATTGKWPSRQFVDFPINSMVDLSMVFCKRLPEATIWDPMKMTMEIDAPNLWYVFGCQASSVESDDCSLRTGKSPNFYHGIFCQLFNRGNYHGISSFLSPEGEWSLKYGGFVWKCRVLHDKTEYVQCIRF